MSPDDRQQARQDVANLRPGEGRNAARSVFQKAEADTVMFASVRALPLEYAEPFAESDHPGRGFGTRIRRKRLSLIVLGLILLMQTVLTVRMHNTAFEDEALYLYVGHLEIAHWLHGAALQGDYPSYFSGAPVLYPVLGAAADSIGGLAAARAVSLLEMLAATALLYSLTRRLFNERVALFAALIFAVAEPTLFLSYLATYDATALCLLAVAAWLVVWGAKMRWPGYLLAAPVLALAVATKYAALLFVPCAIVLAGLAAWPHRGGRSALGRPITLGATTAILLAGALELGGSDYWRGITSTTLQRAASSSSPTSLLWDCVQWIGVPFGLAVIGAVTYTLRPATESAASIASAGSRLRRAALGTVLAGSALLAPAEQIRIGTFVSLQKHVGFGLLFAAPIAGVGLVRIIGDHFRRTQIGIAIWGAALALGMTQANNLFNGWPNTSVSIPEMARYLEPGTHYLVEVPEVPIYYLRDHADAQPDQFTSTYNFTYVGPKGETLNGDAAYTAAIKAGYFRMIVFDYSVTPATDNVISRAVDLNPKYRLAAIVPETTGGRQYIWVRGG
jgi:dolichyl-phosphate-mannose-protein mannosyltransferase